MELPRTVLFHFCIQWCERPIYHAINETLNLILHNNFQLITYLTIYSYSFYGMKVAFKKKLIEIKVLNQNIPWTREGSIYSTEKTLTYVLLTK